MTSPARQLIEAAIAEGRITRVPAGVSGLSRKDKSGETRSTFHPDLCGKGERVSRHNFLDELDGDWA